MQRAALSVPRPNGPHTTTTRRDNPKRFLSEGLPAGDGKALLPRERLQAMIAAYYEARGWERDGRVPAEQVVELGLEDLGA